MSASESTSKRQASARRAMFYAMIFNMSGSGRSKFAI
jgi:hypothetical protein